MFGEPIRHHAWQRLLSLDYQEARVIEENLLPLHEREIVLRSLEDSDQPKMYRAEILKAVDRIGLAADEIVEVSFSELMLPTDMLPEELKAPVRRGLAAGLGNGIGLHLSDHLQDRFRDRLSGSPNFNVEAGETIDNLISKSLLTPVMRCLNDRYHGLFRLKLIGTDRLPFCLPAVLYYQVALRSVGATKEAAALARFNRFFLDGIFPMGMLAPGKFAVLGR